MKLRSTAVVLLLPQLRCQLLGRGFDPFGQTNVFGQPNYQHASPFRDPFPGRDSSSLFPEFPFVATGTGAGAYQRPISNFNGFLDIPIGGWNGIFDLKGGLTFGEGPIEVGVGYLVSPTNVLDINPAAASTVAANPLFQAARKDSQAIPVSRLPGPPNGFTPLSCKPPFCNPYLGNLGVGVNIEPGDDFLIDGDLDFPVPLWAPGGGIRLPIAYGLEVGTTPHEFSYGHGIGPLDFLQRSYDRKRLREARRDGRLLNPRRVPAPPPPGRGNQRPLPSLPDFGRIEASGVSIDSEIALKEAIDEELEETETQSFEEPVSAEEFLRYAALQERVLEDAVLRRFFR